MKNFVVIIWRTTSMFKKGVCIIILLLAVAGSSAFGEAYFVDVNGVIY